MKFFYVKDELVLYYSFWLLIILYQYVLSRDVQHLGRLSNCHKQRYVNKLDMLWYGESF